MTDDTGMLQHAIFSIPRYDDGYCLDDNARALLLMTLLEEAGSDDPAVVRTLAARYLAFVNYAFDRDDRPLQELPVVRAAVAGALRLGGQPRARAVGARRGRRPRRRSRPPEPRRRSVPRRHARGDGVHAVRGRGPTRCSASTSTCKPSRATARVEARRQRARRSAARPVPADQPARLAMVRGLA